MSIVKQFQLKIVIFTAVKNRCILHGRVFVMCFFKNEIVHVHQATIVFPRRFHFTKMSTCTFFISSFQKVMLNVESLLDRCILEVCTNGRGNGMAI